MSPPPHPDDSAVIARWVERGRPPIPVASNERGQMWTTITNLVVYLGNPQDAEERRRAVDWVLEHDPSQQ